MDNRPIGIFDSGLGGLTALKELRHLLPNESFVYFGDTGRVPYGARSPQTLRRFARENIRFLQHYDVKMIVAACGTISSILSEDPAWDPAFPFTGVLRPAAEAACRATRCGRIGVIGTSATIRSGSYERIIRQIMPNVQVFSRACPLFVPLVENGYLEEQNPVTELVARDYLSGLAAERPDTLILGCTHYPLIAPAIRRVMGDGVTLIDPGKETAVAVQAMLSARGICADGSQTGDTRYFASADTEDFGTIAARFLGEPLESAVELVEVDALSRE